MRRLPNGRDDAGRIISDADLKGRFAPGTGKLKIGDVIRAQSRFAQAPVLRIFDHPDDFGLAAAILAHTKAPANRIFVAKVVARESLVYYRHFRRILIILRGKAAPAKNRHPCGFKILRPYVAKVRIILAALEQGVFVRAWRASLNVNATSARVFAEQPTA